jgi:hypothetical protein
MMRWVGIPERTRVENKKPTWASDRLSLSGAFWFEAFQPRTSGLSPDPPWPLPARLAEPRLASRFVPDAVCSLAAIWKLSSPFLCHNGQPFIFRMRQK